MEFFEISRVPEDFIVVILACISIGFYALQLLHISLYDLLLVFLVRK